MGVQSFKFPVDFLNNLEKPIIYIANKHKEILGSVSVYDNLSLTCNLNAFQTVSFKIYRDVDGKKQDYFKLFEEEMLIMIPGVSWYEIHVETNIDTTCISKSITGNSLECKLCDKRLVDFQVNCNDLDIEDYVFTPFYNPTDPEHSLLHKILNVSPIWTVGHVDSSLANLSRSFDESDTDVYSFLTGTVSEAFNCLFTFDTFNCTVNAYDLDKYGRNTDIFVSMDNLAQNMTETVDENSIFTCYRVVGGEDIQIAEVNPNGTNKIYNFEYYLPMMPQELQNKVKSYNEKYQSLKPQYEDVISRLQAQIEKIQDLYTRVPDSLASTDWTKYGLKLLQSQEESFKTQEELYCAQGYNVPADIHYDLYYKNHQSLISVQSEISVRESEIQDAENEYEAIYAELTAIQSSLDMNVWFTEDEWKTLDSYVIEQTYSNDNFGAVDNTTEAELFSMEKELYDKAWKDLSKKCRPQYQYSSTLSNILTIPEFKEFVPYFELGNFIQMETDYDTIVRLRIISYTVDYTNTQNIAVTFSDAIRVKDVYEDSASIQAQANSAAMSFQFNKDQYDKTVKQGNFVAEMRKYGLDVATTAIHNSSNQSQTWDSTGMTFRMWNDERQDFDPEQIKIINNMMVFSDDGFKTSKMAIGKIPIDKNGNYGYGINAEFLMSKLVMSQNLWIENQSGTYKFDDAGFIASSGKNSVRIQPNKSGELFSIYKGNNKQVYINSDGDVEFAGSLKSASGQFAGLVSGGSINIGNGTFTVDSSGNMNASSGTFGGLVSGGSININNKFIVDKDGNVTLPDNATISWGQVTGTSDIATTSQVASITNDTIRTTTVTAENLVVNNGNFTKSFHVELSKDDLIKTLSFDNDRFEVNIQNTSMTNRDNSIVIDPNERDNDIIVITSSNSFGNIVFYCDDLKKGETSLATVDDIPDMSDYLKKNASGKFNADYATSAGGLSGKPSVDLNDCKASNFYFVGSPSAGSSLLPIGYNSKTYHFGHYTGSSERFKNRISDVEEPALDPHRLYDTKICQYKYNTDYLSNPCDCRYNRFVIGFIAEDLETVYPVAVDKDDDGVIMDWNYKYIIPPMLALIQEQHQEIESIKKEFTKMCEKPTPLGVGWIAQR